jgi:hypothetical protein
MQPATTNTTNAHLSKPARSTAITVSQASQQRMIVSAYQQARLPRRSHQPVYVLNKHPKPQGEKKERGRFGSTQRNQQQPRW